jgi:hypothetical protein
MSSGIDEAISRVEPTFRRRGPGEGDWQFSGRPAYLIWDGEWLEVRAPLCGDVRRLLPRQYLLAGLVKAASGDFIRAELPAARDDTNRVFAILRAELEEGLDHFEDEPAPAATLPLEAGKIAECLNGSGFAWNQQQSAFTTALEDGPTPAAFATAEAMGEALAIRTTMARIRDPSARSLEALTHFLLVLNQRLRMARGSLMPDRVTLEVVLPPACVTPVLVKRAVRSLWAGAAAARRECAALLNPQVAEAYLDFHLKGELE